jgi:hypothetical protein
LQNNIRRKFNILGTPIQIETKKWNAAIESKENKKYGTDISIARERAKELSDSKKSKKTKKK